MACAQSPGGDMIARAFGVIVGMVFVLAGLGTAMDMLGD
jgi:hypothetical protein